MSEFNDVCARAGTSKLYLEARNALTIAYPEDYAMLQGMSSAFETRVSGIYLCVTDVTTDTLAGAMVSTAAFSKIKAVAEQCLGKYFWNYEEGNTVNDIADDARLGFAYAFYANRTFDRIVDDLLKICSGAVAGKVDASNLARYIGGAATGWKELQKDALEGVRSCSPSSCTTLPLFKEYSVKTEPARCSSSWSEDGTVKFSSIKIERRVLDKNGKARKAPWTVTVNTLNARPSEKNQSGYAAETVKNETALSVDLTDNEMYDFCYKIEHFVNVWEMANCVELVRQGCRYKDELNRAASRVS